MADDKRAREKQARDADQRQRQRDVEAALARSDEPEPPIELENEAALSAELGEVTFPVTGIDVVAAAGNVVVADDDRRFAVAELVPATETERFESPDEVRSVVRRPTVALSMKRILEASLVAGTRLEGSQRAAYEKTLVEIVELDAADADEAVGEVTDWVLDRVRETGSLPGSRAVRRQAATVCRAHGYEISNNDWLGV